MTSHLPHHVHIHLSHHLSTKFFPRFARTCVPTRWHYGDIPAHRICPPAAAVIVVAFSIPIPILTSAPVWMWASAQGASSTPEDGGWADIELQALRNLGVQDYCAGVKPAGGLRYSRSATAGFMDEGDDMIYGDGVAVRHV